MLGAMHESVKIARRTGPPNSGRTAPPTQTSHEWRGGECASGRLNVFETDTNGLKLAQTGLLARCASACNEPGESWFWNRRSIRLLILPERWIPRKKLSPIADDPRVGATTHPEAVPFVPVSKRSREVPRPFHARVLGLNAAPRRRIATSTVGQLPWRESDPSLRSG